ncbi:hypothetical protein RB195_018371 [Necator americanus]
MTESENVAPSAAGESVNEKVVRQLEYYFGNINLPRDKFLQDSMKQDEGWVPINTLLTFNRLAAITTETRNGYVAYALLTFLATIGDLGQEIVVLLYVSIKDASTSKSTTSLEQISSSATNNE